MRIYYNIPYENEEYLNIFGYQNYHIHIRITNILENYSNKVG